MSAYSGTAGRIENCQLGVFCAYATTKGREPLDRELYLSKSWTGDRERRREAAVHDEVDFATKTTLAKAMLTRAFVAVPRSQPLPAGGFTTARADHLVAPAGTEPELPYYLCCAPAATPDEDLIRVAGARWAIEECFQTAKTEIGLDHYQVRRYDAW
jgi:SRSO17 transposase